MSELTVWWIIGMVGLAAFWWVTDRPTKRAPRAPAPPPAPKPQPPPFRLEDLGAYLDERQRDEEAAEQAEKDRREQLQARWAGIAPAVAEAVEMVNAQLARHAMKLLPDDRGPGFRGDESEPFGFGATYHL